MKPKVRVLILIIICGVLLFFSRSFLSNAGKQRLNRSELLYLPEADFLKLIALGHDGLVSDILLAKAVNVFNSHSSQKIFYDQKKLKKLIFTAIDMDPYNADAFLMGNNILKESDVNGSIELLKLGMFYHPELWKFPEMIGFNFSYYLKNSYLARKYYRIAAKLQDYPSFVPRNPERFNDETDRYNDAIRVLYNFYSSTENKILKESFKQAIKRISGRIEEKELLLKARIIRIMDGDSFEFEPEAKDPQYSSLKGLEGIRMVGINCYEMTEGNERDRLFAHLQKDFAFFTLRNRNVHIELERLSDGSFKRDKFNRLLGYLFLESNKMYQMLALEQGIVKGYYKFYFKREYKKLFLQAETKAKEKKRGFYDFPPEVIDLRDIHRNMGKIVMIRFRVYKVFFGTKAIFLDSGPDYRKKFSAIIPSKYAMNFSKRNQRNYLKSLHRKRIEVLGFLGSYKNKSQMRLYFPDQLKEL